MFIEIQEIQKEEIQNCSFKQTIEHVQSSTLSKKLMDAMKMGNNDHRKVEIIFCDDEGLKKSIPPYGQRRENLSLLKVAFGFLFHEL